MPGRKESRRCHRTGITPNKCTARWSTWTSGDLFFPPEDIKADAERIPGATFRETGTVWGHFTMFNLREQDTAAIDAIYADVLAN